MICDIVLVLVVIVIVIVVVLVVVCMLVGLMWVLCDGVFKVVYIDFDGEIVVVCVGDELIFELLVVYIIEEIG